MLPRGKCIICGNFATPNFIFFLSFLFSRRTHKISWYQTYQEFMRRDLKRPLQNSALHKQDLSSSPSSAFSSAGDEPEENRRKRLPKKTHFWDPAESEYQQICGLNYLASTKLGSRIHVSHNGFPFDAYLEKRKGMKWTSMQNRKTADNNEP